LGEEEWILERRRGLHEGGSRAAWERKKGFMREEEGCMREEVGLLGRGRMDSREKKRAAWGRK
jgi:hypothetical protein